MQALKRKSNFNYRSTLEHPELTSILLVQRQAEFMAALSDLMDAYAKLPPRTRYQQRDIIPGINAGLLELVYAGWRTARQQGRVI